MSVSLRTMTSDEVARLQRRLAETFGGLPIRLGDDPTPPGSIPIDDIRAWLWVEGYEGITVEPNPYRAGELLLVDANAAPAVDDGEPWLLFENAMRSAAAQDAVSAHFDWNAGMLVLVRAGATDAPDVKFTVGRFEG